MSPLIRGLTIALLVLPLILGSVALMQQNSGLVGVALLLVLLYAGVWLGWRPGCFRITDRYLEIVFPVWQRVIPLATITHVRLLGPNEFKQRCGSALRVGVGGLWGGFGWLWTSQRGWVEFYVSRSDQLVLLERSGQIPLLITPRSPHHFVGVLGTKRDRAD